MPKAEFKHKPPRDSIAIAKTVVDRSAWVTCHTTFAITAENIRDIGAEQVELLRDGPWEANDLLDCLETGCLHEIDWEDEIRDYFGNSETVSKEVEAMPR